MEKLQDDRLYQILCAAMPHPAMLLGCTSLQALENYIYGYLDACSEIEPECFTVQWYDAFCSYIAEVFQVRQEKFSISGVFRENGYNDVNGVDYFMKLLKRFSGQKSENKKESALKDGEIRAFRIDLSKATEFVAAHLQEHAEQYFGVPSDEPGAWVYNWSKDQILTCAICNRRTDVFAVSPDDPKTTERIERLPIFSDTDRIRYEILDF